MDADKWIDRILPFACGYAILTLGISAVVLLTSAIRGFAH